ncbi:MAG: hypothetical protein DGJ47_000060 [Rickettsiaceae bacterium]
MATYSKQLNLDSSSIVHIISIISKAKGEARIVGGAVRDVLLGHNPTDIDLATTLQPTELINALKEAKIKTIPTGLQYGTITAFIKGQTIEITSLREDIKCYGRKAEVTFTKSFELDAKRRDFTINAMSYCPLKHEIYDYFNSIDDLQNGLVKFIGNPKQRIQEDYLRILRFFRFSARFAKNIDQDGLNACIQNKEHLSKLSGERIKTEMDNILSLEKTSIAIKHLLNNQFLSKIYPFIQQQIQYDNISHKAVLDSAHIYDANVKLMLYAAIFRNEPPHIKNLMSVKFSRRESIIIFNLIKVSHLNEEELLYTLKLKLLLEENYAIYFAFSGVFVENPAIVQELFNSLLNKPKPVFPISGNDIKEIGINGEEIGKTMNYLKKIWIDSNFSLNKKNLTKMIKDFSF